ncbi:rhamnulokinase family protein [Paenibacillus sp. GCM10023252]|uniref:rhamnulokinase n=1 Tax=Paenibacillus sp. GCM10023252 TaxID=3252649 RepID=UPI00360A3135
MTRLAYDLGASSGRAILGRLEEGRIVLQELHRFPNDPVQVGGRLHWDILRLFHELKQGLLKAKHAGIQLQSVGIDTWGVDFGMVSAEGELLGNPYHYRDRQTDDVIEKLQQDIPAEEIYRRTGIQFQPFNTINQLYAMKGAGSIILREAEQFLMIPALLRYFLTGERYNEFTLATTTQLYNPVAGGWDEELLGRLGLSPDWFNEVVQPGTPVGELRASLSEELGIPATQVYAVAEHDTASAVVAVPALDRSFAFLSCGTWSLVGTEVEQPVISELAQQLNFTNEGGAYGTYRLIKNIMGLWILQECKREWERAGIASSFADLVVEAEQAPPAAAYIDPDDPLFLHPGEMTPRIEQYCIRTGQPAPNSIGEIVRCIIESLALKYRYALELTERLSGQTFAGLHMVGGGIHNQLLCKWTAGALGKPVWAGPAEGSAIGNLVVQWIAAGELADIWEARRVIRDSFPITVYEPEDSDTWEDAYGRFCRVTGL